MFKVTPFFPLSTKDKYTATSFCFMKHKFPRNPSYESLNLCTQTQDKSILDLSRLIQLAQPKTSKLKQTLFTETSPNFYLANRRSLSKKNSPPFYQSQITPKQSKNPPDKINQSQSNRNNNLQLSHYPKISENNKKGIKNLKTEETKENKAIPMLNLRKVNNKCKVLFRESLSIYKNGKLREKKPVFDTELLKSSDLSSIYSSLYKKYEVVSFDGAEESESVEEEMVEKGEREKDKKESQKQIKKERKSFGMKKLDFEKNLRKEIKSLTRDTDHILSLEFKDIQQINMR